MQIQIDSREKARAVTRIVRYFDKNGIGYFVSKLYVADYMSYDNPRLVIDRKQSLGEICANLSDVPKKNKDGKKKHGRLPYIIVAVAVPILLWLTVFITDITLVSIRPMIKHLTERWLMTEIQTSESAKHR